MSTSLTSSRLTIGSYYADEIAGRSSPSIDYSTLATTKWVNDNKGSSSGGAENSYKSYCDVGGILILPENASSSSGSYAGFYSTVSRLEYTSNPFAKSQSSGTATVTYQGEGGGFTSVYPDHKGGGLNGNLLSRWSDNRRQHNLLPPKQRWNNSSDKPDSVCSKYRNNRWLPYIPESEKNKGNEFFQFLRRRWSDGGDSWKWKHLSPTVFRKVVWIHYDRLFRWISTGLRRLGCGKSSLLHVTSGPEWWLSYPLGLRLKEVI